MTSRYLPRSGSDFVGVAPADSSGTRLCEALMLATQRGG